MKFYHVEKSDRVNTFTKLCCFLLFSAVRFGFFHSTLECQRLSESFQRRIEVVLKVQEVTTKLYSVCSFHL